MKHYSTLTLILVLIVNILSAQPTQIASTPPMGWNSWNLFEDEISESIIKEIADAMVISGMRDAGYSYIIIDDHWVGGRDRKNQLFPDPQRFPGGIKALADYVHERGLMLGIYSNAADLTCGGVTGSLHFEELDASTFASWGIDYLKYDYCNAPTDRVTAFERYSRMGEALQKTGRPIVYAICEWGQRQPWLWAKAAGGHLWRTTYDSRDTWETGDKFFMGTIDIFDLNEPLAQYGGPGGWNDPDMLMAGLCGKGKSSSANGAYSGCTLTEYRTQFVLWAMMAAPLIVNADIRKLDPATAEILLDKDILAIAMDSLGMAGKTVYRSGEIQVLIRNLQENEIAVCIFNRGSKETSYQLNLRKDLGLADSCHIRNINWKTSEGIAPQVSGTLQSHDCAVYRLKPCDN